MKKFHGVGLALLAILAVGAFGAISASGHKSTKQIATSVSVNFNPGGAVSAYGQFTNGSFTGTITAKKGCHKNRRVTIQRLDGGSPFASAQSGEDGSYTVVANGPVASKGHYVVNVAAKKIVKKNKGKHKHFVKCQPASEPIKIP